MLEKTPDEFHGFQCYRAIVFAGLWILAPESYFSVLDLCNAVIANGYTMGVTGKVFQDIVRCFSCLLCIDNPFLEIDILSYFLKVQSGRQLDHLFFQ